MMETEIIQSGCPMPERINNNPDQKPIVFTFIRVGHPSNPKGHYGSEYEVACEEGVTRTFSGEIVAEFLHDDDMPPQLRAKGWWSMMQLYNPEADIGNRENIYFTGLDTVFIKDLNALIDAMDTIDRDIVGCRCFQDGEFNTMVLRIRKGSKGARKVWEAAKARNFNFPPNESEHLFVREVAGKYLGMIPDYLALSYKVETKQFTDFGKRERTPLEKASVLVFHGRPRPHEVASNPNKPLHQLIKDNWVSSKS